MKQIIFGISIITMLFSSCAGSQKKTNQESASLEAAAPEAPAPVLERKVAETVPDFVLNAVKKVPPDALVGIGTDKRVSMDMARIGALTRANTSIARQISQTVVVMVRNYSVVSETDPNEVQLFQERITVASTKMQLPATTTIEEDMDDDGNWWVVVMLDKELVSDVIIYAQDEAAGDFPQMAGFDTTILLPDALAAIAKEEITVAR